MSPALADGFLTTAPAGKPYPSFFLNLFYLFIYIYIFWFWPRGVFVAVHRLSLVAVSRGLLFIAECGLLITVTSLVAEHGL